MALTGSFKELMQKRVASGPAFGEALLREGIDTMLAGDVDTGKAIPPRLDEGDRRLRRVPAETRRRSSCTSRKGRGNLCPRMMLVPA